MIRFANIGDIHFQTDRDLAANKGVLLARAIGVDFADIDRIVLLFNGDLTYSGTKEQFDIATHFINSIIAELRIKNTDLKIDVAVCPGNHDCNLSGDQEARNILLKSVTAKRPPESITASVLSPLEPYFEFVESNPEWNGVRKGNPFCDSIVIGSGNDKFELVVLNSSWMSSISEKPGTILFPIGELKRKTESETCIVMMHHPVNWFKQPETMRDLINWITRNADICCFGHEHVSDTQVRLDDCLRGTVYECGGVMQDGPAQLIGEFRTFDLNIADGSYIGRSFRWSNDHFERYKEPRKLNYAEFSARASQTSISPKFRSRLEDPELPGAVVATGNRLQDIFVVPDAMEIGERQAGSKPERIPGHKLTEELLSREKVLLTGGERSGKTSLLKHLFLEYHSKGMVPIFFEAFSLGKAFREKKSIEPAIRKALDSQYSSLSLELFLQQYEDRAVALVDNFEGLFQTQNLPQAVVESLCQKFDHVILIGSEEIAVLETRGTGSTTLLPEFHRLKVCDLGYEKIEELATRWITSNSKISPSNQVNVEVVAKTVLQVLAADFIPHHPWIVLVLLHKSVTDDSMAVADGSYGHLYHAILTSALSTENKSRLDLNGKFTYLSLLAARLYKDTSSQISTTDMRSFHSEYCKKFDVEISFEPVIEGLTSCGVLRRDDAGIVFAARYSFCFFLAWYLKNRIQEEETRVEVERLLTQLYHRESANVLLFLSHLAPGTWALDLILGKAKELFVNAPLWDLDGDTKPLLTLCSQEQQVLLPNTSPSDNRASERRHEEDIRQASVDPTEYDGRSLEIVPSRQDLDEWGEHVQGVQAAYKMIRILGQLLKNNVNSAEGDVKKSIVDEVFRLSRRMLGDGFENLGDEIFGRRQHALKKINLIQVESNKRMGENELIANADKEVFTICWLAAFSVIRVVAEAVGAPGLQRTYKRVLDDDFSIPNRLFESTILMENDGEFPVTKVERLAADLRKNWFATTMLRSLVAYHFYMYDRPYSLKQKMVAKLEINLKRSNKKPESKKSVPRILSPKDDNRKRK